MANPPERLRLDGPSRDRTPEKYLAFDIEIAKAFPDTADDWRQFRPLGICCAATLTSDGGLSLWYSRSAEGLIANQLSVGDAQALVAHLQKAVSDGYVICSWNGLGFDFDILAEESGMYDECRSLALNHVDMLFHFFCLKGFTVGLDVLLAPSLPMSYTVFVRHSHLRDDCQTSTEGVACQLTILVDANARPIL